MTGAGISPPGSGAALPGAAGSASAPAEPLTLVLTLPPTVNKHWAPVRTKEGARMVKRAASESWADLARWTVTSQRGGVTIPYRFHATIVLPETPADIDGRIKPLLDACQAGGAIVNDKHCRRLLVEIDESRGDTVLIELRATADPIPPARRAPGRVKGHARKEKTS